MTASAVHHSPSSLLPMIPLTTQHNPSVKRDAAVKPTTRLLPPTLGENRDQSHGIFQK